MKGKAICWGLHSLLISTSRNLSHHPALPLNKDLNQQFILDNDENQGGGERGLCAPSGLIGYKMVFNLIAGHFADIYKSLETCGCVNFDHLLFSTAVSESP